MIVTFGSVSENDILGSYSNPANSLFTAIGLVIPRISSAIGEDFRDSLFDDTASVFTESDMLNMFQGCFLDLMLGILVSKDKNNWFWEDRPVHTSQTHRNEEFQVLPEADRKVINSKWTGIIFWSFEA